MRITEHGKSIIYPTLSAMVFLGIVAAFAIASYFMGYWKCTLDTRKATLIEQKETP